MAIFLKYKIFSLTLTHTFVLLFSGTDLILWKTEFVYCLFHNYLATSFSLQPNLPLIITSYLSFITAYLSFLVNSRTSLYFPGSRNAFQHLLKFLISFSPLSYPDPRHQGVLPEKHSLWQTDILSWFDISFVCFCILVERTHSDYDVSFTAVIFRHIPLW